MNLIWYIFQVLCGVIGIAVAQKTLAYYALIKT